MQAHHEPSLQAWTYLWNRATIWMGRASTGSKALQPGRRVLQHVGRARAHQRRNQEARILKQDACQEAARDALLHDAEREGDLRPRSIRASAPTLLPLVCQSNPGQRKCRGRAPQACAVCVL